MELRTIIDDQGFAEMLAGTAHRISSLEPVMRLVGQVVVESIDKTFAAEGRPDAWQALADSTLLRKMAGGVRLGKDEKRKRLTTTRGWTKAGAINALVKSKILAGQTGRLREGIHVEATGKDFVDVAPDKLPYARIHHLGGEAGRDGKVTIPARPYLVVQNEDAGRIETLIADYILGD